MHQVSLDRIKHSDENVIQLLQTELDTFKKLGLLFEKGAKHARIWNRRFERHGKRLIGENYRVDPRKIRNFRRLRLYVADNPSRNLGRLSLRNMLDGERRGEKQLLRMCLEILETRGFAHLLAKYPCHPAGNPVVFNYKGYEYTHRWFKHIYMLGLMNEVLGHRLNGNFVVLDIGSAYGVFSSLVHQEYAASKQVLVDLPEQLLLARYFLSSCFPDAKIAGVKEISREGTINREFLNAFDFVLIPWQFYENLAPSSIDLVTSFASLGELKRSFFDYYVKAPAFQTAQFFFTVNLVASSLWFEELDLTILDYPIWDPNKKLHFGLSTAFFHPYSRPRRKLGFFYDLRPFNTFFEYIGEL